MSRQTFIALIAAAVLAISAALYLNAQRNPAPDPHGSALLPSLAGELDTVTALSVRRGNATPTVTVHQQGGHWTVAERGDYPADVAKLRKLLLALSDAKVIEQKTSNPASFAVIGVDDPASPGATGAEISVVARDGKHAVIVGKPVGAGNPRGAAARTRVTSSNPAFHSKSNPAIGSIHGCSTSRPPTFKASASSRRRGPRTPFIAPRRPQMPVPPQIPVPPQMPVRAEISRSMARRRGERRPIPPCSHPRPPPTAA